LESLGRIDPFPLGARDAPDWLLIPEKLYGREREIDILLAAFDRVMAEEIADTRARVRLCLHRRVLSHVRMYGQIRKKREYETNEINETNETCSNVSFVSFISFVSYSLLSSVAVHPNETRSKLELVIGKRPPVPDLPPRDAQNRFQMVFRRFLGVFARPEQGKNFCVLRVLSDSSLSPYFTCFGLGHDRGSLAQNMVNSSIESAGFYRGHSLRARPFIELIRI
jgi:hypothetical protein